MATMPTPAVETAVHPMHKVHTIVSSKTVDVNNLTHLEAVSMSLALVLAVTIGLLQATVLS